MDRRNFLVWVGVGAIASSLPVAIAASFKNLEAAEASEPRFIEIGKVDELDKSGQIFRKSSAVGPILVIRNPKHKEALSAVNPTCTHRGCAVSWEVSKFVCPCHQGQFDATGEVISGPPPKPLKTYEAKIQGNSVMVKATIK